MNSNTTPFRQGDVWLVPVPSIPAEAAQGDASGGVVLAYGEVTGHAHRVAAGTVSLWHAGRQRYITVPEDDKWIEVGLRTGPADRERFPGMWSRRRRRSRRLKSRLSPTPRCAG